MEWDVTFFARDLSSLITLIKKYNIPIEQSELHILESKLQNCDSVEFDAQNIEFTLFGMISGTIPARVNMFSIFLSHSCYLDEGKDFSTQDPFVNDTGYSFLIDIIGFEEDKKDPYHLSFHLDRHIEGGSL